MYRLILVGLIAAVMTGCSPKKAPQPDFSDPQTGQNISGQQVAQPKPAGPSEPCDNVYTYAPGNFIIELTPDSDSEVVLDPSAHEFPIFCKPADARKAVNAGMKDGTIQKGDWKIYKLKGTYTEIGKEKAPGQFILAKETIMTDWVKE